MAFVTVVRPGGSGTGDLLIGCVAEHGSAAHPYFSSAALTSGPESARNLADAVHFLCSLHGRHPGVVDHAAGRPMDDTARAWLIAAGEAMATERLCLTQLAVAVGPVPSTPGGGASEAAVIGQHNALTTLAQSERRGCALGASLAFAIDWSPVRVLLEAVGRRLGVDLPPCRLSDEDELRSVADLAGQSPATERALLFGAQQLSLQHRGLWDLLEARQQARLEG
ncbi:hypothetical protein [Sphingosinicella sp. CPCC 101087]|uniref:DUF6975 family protein n=1 Tax=Sphingosinicella sp. CPCC 101087 TaxID=2497754 RepID=UPI001FB16DB9|nr:hypothetical protein [Sphingosinicella sp. CPCC 101087]